MHRDEVKIFRGNIETHLLRILSFSRPQVRALPPTVVKGEFPADQPTVAFPPDYAAPNRSTRERVIRIIVRAFSRMMIPSVLLGALSIYLAADFAPDDWLLAFLSYWPLAALGLSAGIVFLAILKAFRERDES